MGVACVAVEDAWAAGTGGALGRLARLAIVRTSFSSSKIRVQEPLPCAATGGVVWARRIWWESGGGRGCVRVCGRTNYTCMYIYIYTEEKRSSHMMCLDASLSLEREL